MGESGTLASAASPRQNPMLIYTGGQNNGASSGVLRTTDGGKHWLRKSKGLWDTRIIGVFLHPDDNTGAHVLAGTHSGVYESTDSAESWAFRNETAGWGFVMSFALGMIQGEQYIIANSANGILTLPVADKAAKWQRIPLPSPPGIAPNQHLSLVTTEGTSEVLISIGSWAAGKLYYGNLKSPTTAHWTGPLGSASESGGVTAMNVWVDPNDRNHLVYSKMGSFAAGGGILESKDAGETFKQLNQTAGVYFVQVRSPKLPVGCSHSSLHTNNLPCCCPRSTSVATSTPHRSRVRSSRKTTVPPGTHTT